MKVIPTINRSLSLKIMAVAGLFFIGLIGLLVLMGYLTTYAVIHARLHERAATMASILACATQTVYDGSHELNDATRANLQHMANDVVRNRPISNFALLDPDGNPLVSAASAGKPPALTKSRIREIITSPRIDVWNTSEVDCFAVATALRRNAPPDGVYGLLCFTLDLSVPSRALHQGLWNRILLAAAAGAVIGFTMIYVLLRLVIRPVRELAQQVARLAQGDFSARNGSRRASDDGDEIQQLQYAFDHMAQQLEQSLAERSAAAEALRESQQRFDQFMNNSPAVAFMKTEQGRYVYLSGQFERTFGRENGAIIGKTHVEVWPPDTARQMAMNDKATFLAGKTLEFIQTIPHPDGNHQWLTLKFPVASPRERLLAGIAVDITDLKRAEELLHREKVRFQALVENSTDMITIAGADGRITYISPPVHRILGYQPEELAGKIGFECVHPRDRAAYQHRFRRMAATPRAVERFEVRFRHHDGSWRILEIIGQNLIADPNVGGIVFNSRDITERVAQEQERRQLEAQMQHAQKLESLGVLAGGIAHDFNNLLMGVLGNAGLCLMDLSPESPAYESVKHIETAALRAADLTRQMLAYSGRGKLVLQPVNLSRVVEEMIHLLRAAISKNATLNINFAPDLPAVSADPTQIRQVVMNLITNASDALGEQPGIINVRAYVTAVTDSNANTADIPKELPPGCYATLEVADTGAGMDERVQSRIYEPFFTTKFTGRGLGLAAVLGIIRGHHGAIKVTSAPGEGATFQVFFPCSTETESAPEEPPTPESWSMWRGHGVILVVDDEAVVRSTVRTVLERCGLTVLDAENGREALDVFQQHEQSIAAILLDVTMPLMNGEEACRELRRIKPDVRIILSSGYTEQDTFERFKSESLTDFIQKPYKPRALVEKIRQTLRQS